MSDKNSESFEVVDGCMIQSKDGGMMGIFGACALLCEYKEKLQAAEENLTECASNYWKEVGKRKAAEEKTKELEKDLRDSIHQFERLVIENENLEEENKILRDAVEFLRSKLCELVIDDCGYNPENEDRDQLIGAVYGSSERCEELLSYIDCELEKVKRGGE
jgi:ABC-type enterochelin transport system substrate-binding protein